MILYIVFRNGDVWLSFIQLFPSIFLILLILAFVSFPAMAIHREVSLRWEAQLRKAQLMKAQMLQVHQLTRVFHENWSTIDMVQKETIHSYLDLLASSRPNIKLGNVIEWTDSTVLTTISLVVTYLTLLLQMVWGRMNVFFFSWKNS